MRKTIEVICSFCKKKFPKDIREFNRNKKIGRSNFCSLVCTGKASGRWAKRDKSLIRNFKGKIGTRPIDEFSPFRHYLGQINNSTGFTNFILEETI